MLKFLGIIEFSAYDSLLVSHDKKGCVCSGGSVVESLSVFSYRRTTYLINGPEPMSRTILSTLYSRSSTFRYWGISRLSGEGTGLSEAEVIFRLVRVP